MKKFNLYAILIIMLLLICQSGISFAQEVDLGDAEQPEQVIKLEELAIQIEPLKVFIIPRVEAELPPIDFLGIFMWDYMNPDPRFFEIDYVDFEPILSIPRKQFLDKERK